MHQEELKPKLEDPEKILCNIIYKLFSIILINKFDDLVRAKLEQSIQENEVRKYLYMSDLNLIMIKCGGKENKLIFEKINKYLLTFESHESLKIKQLLKHIVQQKKLNHNPFETSDFKSLMGILGKKSQDYSNSPFSENITQNLSTSVELEAKNSGGFRVDINLPLNESNNIPSIISLNSSSVSDKNNLSNASLTFLNKKHHSSLNSTNFSINKVNNNNYHDIDTLKILIAESQNKLNINNAKRISFRNNNFDNLNYQISEGCPIQITKKSKGTEEKRNNDNPINNNILVQNGNMKDFRQIILNRNLTNTHNCRANTIYIPRIRKTHNDMQAKINEQPAAINKNDINCNNNSDETNKNLKIESQIIKNNKKNVKGEDDVNVTNNNFEHKNVNEWYDNYKNYIESQFKEEYFPILNNLNNSQELEKSSNLRTDAFINSSSKN